MGSSFISVNPVREIDRDALPMTLRMSKIGMGVDRNVLDSLRERFTLEQDNVTLRIQKLVDLPDLNPGSRDQTSKLLFSPTWEGGLGLPARQMTRSRKRFKVDDKVLKGLKQYHPIVPLLLDYNQLDKLLGTYIHPLYDMITEYGRIHPHLKVTRVPTGRYACDEPNLLAIPARSERGKLIRSIFVAGLGRRLISVDLDQIEVRIAAHMSQDPKLCQIFRDGTLDIHCMSAAMIYGKKYEDILAAHKSKEGSIERTMAKCVHPDTIVWDHRGYPTLIGKMDTYGEVDEFVSRTDARFILGTSKLTSVKKYYNGGSKALIHVVSNRGILTCSEQHQIKLANGKLVKAGNLHKNDILLEPELPKLKDFEYECVSVTVHNHIPVLLSKMTHDHAYFAGMYMGDGCGPKSGKSALSVAHGPVDTVDKYGNFYADWQAKIVEACITVGLSPACRKKSVHLGKRFVERYTTALGITTGVGGRGKTYSIPSWVLSAGRTALLHFMAGMFDTDGTVSVGALSLTTKDATFAGQMASILTSLGMQISVEECWNKTYLRYYYRIRVSTKTSIMMEPYLHHEGKKFALKKHKHSDHDMCPRKPHFVRCIVAAGSQQCVDIEVGHKDHLYVANSFLTHNSASFGILYGISARGLAEQMIASGAKNRYRALILTEVSSNQWKPEWDDNMDKRTYAYEMGWEPSEDAIITRIEQDCDEVIRGWFDAYSGVKDWLAYNVGFMDQYGYAEDMFGRRVYLEGVWSPIERVRDACLRSGGNHPIQSSACGVLKIAMANMGITGYSPLDWSPIPELCGSSEFCEPLLPVHDELIWETDEGNADNVVTTVARVMSEVGLQLKLDVPLGAKGKHAASWYDLK